MNGERIFQVMAVALAGVAAWFLWNGDTDWLFAAAVLASCCFFISIRFQIKDRMQTRQAAESEFEEEELADETEGTPQ
jgi:hypothetical protein